MDRNYLIVSDFDQTLSLHDSGHAMSEMLGIEVGFVQWMMVGVPFAAILLVVAWLLLIAVYPPGRLSGNAAGLLVFAPPLDVQEADAL